MPPDRETEKRTLVMEIKGTKRQAKLLSQALENKEILEMDPEEALQYFEYLFLLSLSALYSEIGPENVRRTFEDALAIVEKSIPSAEETQH